MATLQLFGKFGANVLGGEAAGDAGQMDFLSDVIKATLHTNTWVPNIDTNEAFADATNELTTANGYTANGITLANKTVVYNATGNVTTYSADDFSWTASGGSLVFRYVVFHDDTVATGPPVKPLIGYIDANAGGNLTLADGNTFTVDITASGLFTATVT
jgi:hypothetical protein